jgi:hypothetical protein
LADKYELRDVEVVRHYYEYLGQETRVRLFDNLPSPSPSPIFVMEFTPSSDKHDWIYATVGASRKAQKLETEGRTLMHRTELILFSKKQSDEIVEALLTLAAYPFIYETVFNAGDLIAGTPGIGVVADSPLTEILLTHVYFLPPKFEVITHADGDTTHVLLVVPIYTSEHIFAREHGQRELERLFGAQGMDPSDFWRRPVV